MMWINENAMWHLRVEPWEMPRWRSALEMLRDKPLTRTERIRVEGLKGLLEERGQLSSSAIAILRAIADKYESPLPTIPALPVALSQSKHGEEHESQVIIMTKLAVVPPTPIEVPEVKYPLPKLAIETRTTAQQRWAGTLIDAEGSFYIKRERKNMVAPEEYKYEYLVPVFEIEMFDEPPMTIFAELTGLPLHHYPPRYMCWVERETAVAMAKWAIPFFMPNGIRQRGALRILRTFQEHPSIKRR